jgi:hypothetical protein
MYLVTYRVERGWWSRRGELTVDLITDDPDLAIDMIKTIKGVEFTVAGQRSAGSYHFNRVMLSLRVTKGAVYIPRIIPPHTGPSGKWMFWKTLDQERRK